MRVSLLSLVLVVLVGMAALAGTSRAEKVTTNQGTKVRARPGETAKILLEVDSGKSMTVLARDGRWIKVRVSGRTGYVTRSSVDGDDAEIPRNTRRRAFVDGRSTRRGPGGDEAPDDRVGADALGEGQDTGDGSDSGDSSGGDEPSKPHKPHKPEATGGGGHSGDGGDTGDGGDGGDASGDDGDVVVDDAGGDRPTAHVSRKTKVLAEASSKSDLAFTATSGTVLFPSETKGKYTWVENEEGDGGYVLTSALERDEVADADGGDRGGRQIDLRARAGVSFVTQGVRVPATGAGFPNNYNISTAAARIAIGGAVMYPYKARYVLGGEAGYDLARSAPGVSFMGSTTAITFHNLVVRGMAGYDLKTKSGAIVFARLALGYQSQQVAHVGDLAKNTAKIPSEIVIAPLLGVALAMPSLTPNIGLRVSLDAILAGASVKQTRRLEDGASPSVKAAIVGVGFTYRYKPALTIQGTYDLSFYKYAYGAQVADSNRIHGTATSSARSDVMHTVTIGIAKAF